MKRLVRSTLVVLGALTLLTPPTAGAESPCGLSGAFRIYSARIDYAAGGAGVMPPGTRQVVLAAGHWQFGSSGGSFRVLPVTGADWRRWGVQPYGPTRKVVFSGWSGAAADGPIEGEGSTVDFFWLIYPVRPPVVRDPGIVSLKFGHAVVPRSCGSAGAPGSGTAKASGARARVVLAPVSVTAGNSVRVKAGPFRPGEEISITDTYRFNGAARTSSLLSGKADGRGMITFERTTVPQTPLGRHTLCVTGALSKRRACASFVVRAASGSSGSDSTEPNTGPGYQAPQVGPGYQAPGSNP